MLLNNPSLRTDVSTNGFYLKLLLLAKEKVFPDSEDFLLHPDEVLKMAK